MVWKEFARAEAASRIVVVHNSVKFDPLNNTPRLNLYLMPLKRLVSPLLSVSAQSRQAALRHYRTPVNLYELGSPVPWSLPDEPNRADYERTAWPPLYRHPRTAAWAPEGDWARYLEYLVCCRSEDQINTGRKAAIELLAETTGSSRYPHRGRVHLDLETDRFLFYDRWRYHPRGRPEAYGLRALADAMLDYKYHWAPFNLEKILARRPPILRNASAALLPEMMARIRNVVFEAPSDRSSDRASRHGPTTAAGATAPGGVSSGVSSTKIFHTWGPRLLPRAFSPEGSIGGYVTTPEMSRCFYDDIEDKGPDHLRIAKVKLVRGPDDAEDEMGWLDWGTDEGYDSNEEDEVDFDMIFD
ncbi:hypothetical protein PG991_003457 [Apiospora marii]|uniref:Uncharacterized protein n=2 Tax=Apiospora marii TaxID=335849 RepID=A0ABR1S3X0_9PEZI